MLCNREGPERLPRAEYAAVPGRTIVEGETVADDDHPMHGGSTKIRFATHLGLVLSVLACAPTAGSRNGTGGAGGDGGEAGSTADPDAAAQAGHGGTGG